MSTERATGAGWFRSLGAHLRAPIAGLTVLALVACTPLVRTYGYVPTEEDLSEIIVGVDTRDTVADVIGAPTSSGVLRESGYYYVAQTKETVGARAPRVIEREVVAISFDQAGVVTNIERFGLEDGNVVALTRRVTDSNVQGVSFLRQLLGGLGQLAPGALD